MELWQIILGVFTAAFLIFLRNAQQKAQTQKIAATRLRSYLMYWHGFVLENDLFNIFHMGVKWNEEIQKIIEKGGSAEELVSLKDEKRKELEGLKKEIEEESEKIDIDKEALKKAISKIPPNTSENILQYSMKTEQNIVDGKTFITDDEASCLGTYTAQTAIELKMHLISMLNSGVGLLFVVFADPEDFELKKHSDDIVKLVWKGILVSKHIDSLTKEVDFFY